MTDLLERHVEDLDRCLGTLQDAGTASARPRLTTHDGRLPLGAPITKCPRPAEVHGQQLIDQIVDVVGGDGDFQAFSQMLLQQFAPGRGQCSLDRSQLMKDVDTTAIVSLHHAEHGVQMAEGPTQGCSTARFTVAPAFFLGLRTIPPHPRWGRIGSIGTTPGHVVARSRSTQRPSVRVARR